MAQLISAHNARFASPASLNKALVPLDPSFVHQAEQALRSLKTRVQARFPFVRSSHLSEAIASSLGYNTNAALRADLPRNAIELAYSLMDVTLLRERLKSLNYKLNDDLSTQPAPTLQPPPEYLARLRELKRLQENPEHVYPRIQKLRAECAKEFANAFGLGHPENVNDTSVQHSWFVGVDHHACLPGWGELANAQHGGRIDFPASDHRVHFFRDLPLARTSMHCEYQTGFVSMPYSSAVRPGGLSAKKFGEAAVVAGRLGWTMSMHSAWSWYQAGQTELVLFRRTTQHDQILQQWEHSFSRWLLENRTRLMNSSEPDVGMVIEDVLSCPHIPFDVRDYEDCRERYLREFSSQLYGDRKAGLGPALERLLQTWLEARTT
ncbi:MAG: hypothetical protein C4535_14550 [Comamonadaceae bacterium]|nr:MAG: hypothetical protein C4535_14550 [Comamonadaceae bacterium]